MGPGGRDREALRPRTAAVGTALQDDRALPVDAMFGKAAEQFRRDVVGEVIVERQSRNHLGADVGVRSRDHRAARAHRGFSFVRILQRCPEWLPNMLDPWVHDPLKTLLLTHEDGVTLSPNLSKVYKTQERHDPSNINRAREVASLADPIPVGILYRNPDVSCYEELRNAGQQRSTRYIKSGLDAEFDKFTIWPQDADSKVQPSA